MRFLRGMQDALDTNHMWYTRDSKSHLQSMLVWSSAVCMTCHTKYPLPPVTFTNQGDVVPTPLTAQIGVITIVCQSATMDLCNHFIENSVCTLTSSAIHKLPDTVSVDAPIFHSCRPCHCHNCRSGVKLAWVAVYQAGSVTALCEMMAYQTCCSSILWRRTNHLSANVEQCVSSEDAMCI